MLPLREISAVLKIPHGQIIPIPEMPPWVMGVYNWRGEIIWMVDLGHLIGLAHWYQQSVTSSNHEAIIIHPSNQPKATQTSGEMIGLIVSKVEDLESSDPQEIYSPPASAVSQELAPFLRGYWLKSGGDILVTLDGEAILAAMPKKEQEL
jgi:positive phototaxis protein PixI